MLAPPPVRYRQLILRSDRTPQLTPGLGGILASLAIPVKAAVRMLRDSWGSERFSSEDTSVENEMSVVQFANIAGETIVLTGDAGRDGMTEAADYAPNAGLYLPGVRQFQVPHHGGRRNLSTEVCDRWLGPRLLTLLPEGSEAFNALISSAKEDTDHPRKAVIRAMRYRGAFVATTEDAAFAHTTTRRIPGPAN